MTFVDLGSENDARMARLREALRLGSGFQLVVVQVEPGAQREEVIRRLLAWSGQDGVPKLVVVQLARGVAPLAQLVGEHEGVILTGLEAGSDAVETRAFVVALNWIRNRLPELVPGPLILVISQRVQATLFEEAPDLYSWRTHSTRIVPRSTEPTSYPSTDASFVEDPLALEEMIQKASSLLPVPRRELARLYGHLSVVRARRGGWPEAEAAFDVAYDYAVHGGTVDERIDLLLMRSRFLEQPRGRLEAAEEWLNRAFGEATTGTASPATIARMLAESVIVAFEGGDLERATRELPAALEAVEEVGDLGASEAELVTCAAEIAWKRGDLEEAEALQLDAIKRYQLAGNILGQATILTRLAILVDRRGRSDDAERYASEALAFAEARRASNMIAHIRATLGRIMLAKGDVARAESVLGGEMAITHPFAMALVATARGHLALHHGDLVAAAGQFRSAIQAYEKFDPSHASIPKLALQLGEIGVRRRDWQLARTGYETALRIGTSSEQAIAIAGIATVDLEQGDRTTAMAARLDAAATLLRAADEPGHAAELQLKRAEVLASLGRVPEARAELASLQAELDTRGQSSLALETRAALDRLG